MISAGANYSQTISQNQCSGLHFDDNAKDTEFIFTNVPVASEDGTLTVSIQGDYGGFTSERVGVVVEGEFLGYVPESGTYNDCLCYLLTRNFTVTRQQINQWNADGKIEVTLVQAYGTNNNLINCHCGVNYCDCGEDLSKCGNINIVTLEYEVTGTAKKSLPMNWIIKKFGLGKEK